MTQSSPDTVALAATTENRGRRLMGATALMASGTMVSRILGLVRAIMIAFILGNGTMRAGVLSLALTVPSSLYMLLAGGTLNNVLVPQVVRAVTHDSDGGKAFVDRIMTGFLIALGGLTIIFTVAAPLVMSVYTKPLWRTPEMADQWRSLILMSYLVMPQIFFYGIFFLIGQVLNAREKFGPMMWAPIANNVVSIASLSLYLSIWGAQATSGAAFTDQQAWLLAIGSTVGIITQTVILIPYLKRAGFSYRPRFDLKGTGLGRTFHVARWMIGFVALTSLAQVVITNLASGGAVASGDVGGAWNAYQNAYLIWILPHSLLTISLATAMLPAASTQAQAGNLAGVAAETNRALRLALTFLVPASVAFVVLAGPITRVPFGNGVGATDYHFVSWALAAFGIGLVPFTIQYLYLRAFYALDNTKTPFFLQIWISGANAVLAVLLAAAWTNPESLAARLALAYSASYFLGVFLTHRALHRRLPELAGRDTMVHIGKLLLASLPAVILAGLITWAFAGSDSVMLRLAALVIAGMVGILIFFFAAKRFGIPEAASLLDILRRRKGESSEPDPTEATLEETEGEQLGMPGATMPPNLDPDGVGVFVPASLTAEPLDYPEPDTGAIPGQVLAERYELAEALAADRNNQTWRARDTALSRPVLVQLLDPDEPQTAQVISEARAAAVATDSRFLRVLDVVDDADAAQPYLVYEYEAGQTLEKLLRSGPLSAAEAAWLIREVADALVPLHASGHYHGHLTPANLLITSNGNVKILGFGVDAALRMPQRRTSITAATDVLAIGDLLYAALTAHWPLGNRFGLPAAPVVDGHPLAPMELVDGVSPQLNALVLRARSANPASTLQRPISGQDLVSELTVVLGSASAANDLRGRVDPESRRPRTTSAMVPPIPTPASSRIYVEEPVPASPRSGSEDSELADSEVSGEELSTPIPPPEHHQLATLRKAPLLLLSSALVWAVGLVAAGILTAQPTAAQAIIPLAISHAESFDPSGDGGNGKENPASVVRATDASPTTAWLTERYSKATVRGKSGVGLLLDLGSTRSVSSVDLGLVGTGTDLEVRIPDNPSQPSTKTVQDWKVVGSAKNAPSQIAVTMNAPASTRYLLIYLTKLPSSGKGKYQGGITQITVYGN